MSQQDAPTELQDAYTTWMTGGEVAQKTNKIINTLIREMNQQDSYRINTTNLNRVIEVVTGVGSDDTLEEYRKRVGTHGPFHVQYGNYHLLDEYRDLEGSESV